MKKLINKDKKYWDMIKEIGKSLSQSKNKTSTDTSLLEEWTSKDILTAYKKGGLASIVYQAQVDYVGKNHEVKSIELFQDIFEILEQAEPFDERNKNDT